MLNRFANPVMLAVALMLVPPAATALKSGSGSEKSKNSAWETETNLQQLGKTQNRFLQKFLSHG